MEANRRIDRLQMVAKALSEETRIRILLSLETGALSLQHLTAIFGLAPSTMSKHLHILEDVGLIVCRREGRWRYFQWPERTDDVLLKSALNWVREATVGDPSLESDTARRMVALSVTPAPPPKTDRAKVLFLCTANSCRSQMAEAFLRAQKGDRFDAFSAGVSPQEIPELTAEVMREIGIDMSGQKPKSVMQYMGKTHFDYLITVCALAEQHTPVFPGVSTRLHWPVEDPLAARGSMEQRIAVFRRVRDEIRSKILQWVEEVRPTRMAG